MPHFVRSIARRITPSLINAAFAVTYIAAIAAVLADVFVWRP